MEEHISLNKSLQMAEIYQSYFEEDDVKKHMFETEPKSQRQAEIIFKNHLIIIDTLVGNGLLCLNEDGLLKYCSVSGDSYDDYVDYIKAQEDLLKHIDFSIPIEQKYKNIKIRDGEVIDLLTQKSVGVVKEYEVERHLFPIYQMDTHSFSSAPALVLHQMNETE